MSESLTLLFSLNPLYWRVIVGFCLLWFAVYFNFVHQAEAEPRVFMGNEVITSAPNPTITVIEDKGEQIQQEAQAVLTKALKDREEQKQKLVNYLSRYHSPLIDQADFLIETANNFGLDWRLLPAISVVESSGGVHIPPGSHNAWGWAIYTGRNSGAGWSDWPSAITSVAQGIRDGYKRRGLKSPEQMNAKYAADKNWGYKVRQQMNKISPF